MNKLTIVIHILFVTTILTWFFLDVHHIVKTPFNSINHWIPELALITLVIYKWKIEGKQRKLWLSFLWVVSWIVVVGTFLGATIFQKLATMTVFLSALWLGLFFGTLKNWKDKK